MHRTHLQAVALSALIGLFPPMATDSMIETAKPVPVLKERFLQKICDWPETAAVSLQPFIVVLQEEKKVVLEDSSPSEPETAREQARADEETLPESHSDASSSDPISHSSAAHSHHAEVTVVETEDEPEAAALSAAYEVEEEEPVWHIGNHYICDYFCEEIGDTLTEWAPHYFCAHNFTPDGEHISALPQFVEVDGQLYELDACQEGSYLDSYTAEMEAWATDGGCICFQTYTGDGEGIIQVRYRPV